MQIDDIAHKELTPSEYEVLSRDRERRKRMAPAAIPDDWLAHQPGLMIRRRLAMRLAFTKAGRQGLCAGLRRADEG
jgi:hypothetical protein